MRRLRTIAAAVTTALCVAGGAAAGRGTYVFDGGTAAEQTQVRDALNASSFDWSLVPERITIHIGRDIPTSQAAPGEIWIDAALLDSGEFSWAFVQHEYAHQVDFFLLDDSTRAVLEHALGGVEWFPTDPLPHSAYGCERFASTLAWSYWQSGDNALKPRDPGDESAALSPARFRALLTAVLQKPMAAPPHMNQG